MIKNQLTYGIIGCGMKVHSKLGPDFQEVIYQRCLAIELERAKLDYLREQEQILSIVCLVISFDLFLFSGSTGNR